MSAPDEKGSGESDVFSGLPRSRPQRRSARRKAGGDAGDGGAPKARPPQSPAKPKAKAARKPKAKAAPKPRVAAKPKAAAKPRTARRGAAAGSRPPIPRSGYATPDQTGVRGGADAVGAAVQAFAELAKSVLGRLPKP